MAAAAPESLLEPLTPRSIVLSVLLGSHPPRMPVGRILDFTSLFGLADGAVRTALSRMVANGDLVNDDGAYRLAGRLVARQAQQDTGRHHPPTDWDGSWWTVAVLPDRRTMAERRAFRTWATGARLGELRPDLWLRPANIEIPTDAPDALVTRGPIITGDAHQLVAQLWNLDDVRDRSLAHEHALDHAAHRLGERDDQSLVDAFVALAAVQRFLRTEPQLPHELETRPSSGPVRDRYGEVVDAFQDRLRAFFARKGAERISTGVR
jgi:phenylacetic acid degradation operon negative regulatory protein